VRICVGKKPNAAVINCNEVCINAKKKKPERGAQLQETMVKGRQWKEKKAFEVETGTAEFFF
jgi:hypothetical protein